MEIIVHGHRYRLLEDDTMYHHTNNYAKHRITDLSITYDPSMKKTVIGEGIFHELMEATNYWCNTNLDHKDLTLISMFLYGILKENPNLRKLLFEELNEVENAE